MSKPKVTPIDDPLRDAYQRWLTMFVFYHSYYGQTGPSGHMSDVQAVAVSCSLASEIKDAGFRKAVLHAGADFINRAADRP